jgi:predicted transcriptional regulator
MGIKLFDSEIKVMDVLWREGDVVAKHIAEILTDQIGWNKNTTYTVIKKCVDKGALERKEPNFLCHAIISKEQAQESEVNELVDKLFDGSADLLFASLIDRKVLPTDVAEKLRDIVGTAGGENE